MRFPVSLNNFEVFDSQKVWKTRPRYYFVIEYVNSCLHVIYPSCFFQCCFVPFINSVFADVNNQLGSAQNTIQSTINNLNVLNQIRSYFVNARNSISQLFIDYKNNFDFYRYCTKIMLAINIYMLKAKTQCVNH